jgi:hypothetical protein
MNEYESVKREIESKLQKIIVYLRNKGMLVGDDSYKSSLGRIGIIASTFGLALSLGKESALSDMMAEFSNELLSELDNPEELDMDYILKMMGGQDPELN